MTVLSNTFTAAGVSSTLREKRGVDVALAYTGGTSISGSFQVEKAMSPDESAWGIVLGPYNANLAAVAASYHTLDQDTRLRLRCTSIGGTSENIVLSLTDSPKVVMTRTDDDLDALESGTVAVRTFNSDVICNNLTALGNLTVTGQLSVPDVLVSISASSAVPAPYTLNRLDTSGFNVLLPAPTVGVKYKFFMGGGTSSATTLKSALGTSLNPFLFNQNGVGTWGTITVKALGSFIEMEGISTTQFVVYVGQNYGSSTGPTFS